MVVNTTIAPATMSSLPDLSELPAQHSSVCAWRPHFLVPTARALLLGIPSASQLEAVLEWLCTLTDRLPYRIEPREAPHFRRYWLSTELARGARETSLERRATDMAHGRRNRDRESTDVRVTHRKQP